MRWWRARRSDVGGGDAMRSEALVAYLEGEVTPSEASVIEERLSGSAQLREQLADLRAIRAALSRPIPAIESMDIVGPLRQAIAQAEVNRRAAVDAPAWPRFRRAIVPMAAAAGLVGVVGVVGMRFAARSRPPVTEEFRAKSAGAPGAATASTRWAGVLMFHVPNGGNKGITDNSGGGEPQHVGPRLPARDGLLFGYTNLGPQPFGYLMIFAIDARGAVHWCHPAYERRGTNPTSIPIQSGVARAILPEVIHHDLARGPLEIRALFSTRPLSVSDVEAWLAAHAGSVTSPPWPGVVQQVIETDVVLDGAAGVEGAR